MRSPAAACGGVVALPPIREAENPERRFTAPRPQADTSHAAESPSQDPEPTALPSPSRWSRTSVATLPPRLRGRGAIALSLGHRGTKVQSTRGRYSNEPPRRPAEPDFAHGCAPSRTRGSMPARNRWRTPERRRSWTIRPESPTAAQAVCQALRTSPIGWASRWKMNGQSSGAALPGCLIGASRAVGLLDDAPSAAWLRGALDVRWARDPFDRLLAAHARLRGWRIATGDGAFLRHLGRARCIEL
jgi:hypothetical protein